MREESFRIVQESIKQEQDESAGQAGVRQKRPPLLGSVVFVSTISQRRPLFSMQPQYGLFQEEE
jgi:hypothetical protein